MFKTNFGNTLSSRNRFLIHVAWCVDVSLVSRAAVKLAKRAIPFDDSLSLELLKPSNNSDTDDSGKTSAVSDMSMFRRDWLHSTFICVRMLL